MTYGILYAYTVLKFCQGLIMTQSPIQLERLKSLSQEKSSERRRELLREVTDLFFESDRPQSEPIDEHFDEILTTITTEMDIELRKEMASRFAPVNNAPQGLVRQLAEDDFEVAEPVLRHSPTLSDVDLTRIVGRKSQAHMRAISTRDNISEEVTGAIVAKGDEQTLITLTQNQGAQFSRDTMETLINKSETQLELQSPLVNHKNIPPDMMNEMYFFVEKRLRQRILERNENTTPEELDRAFEQARSKVLWSTDLPSDFEEARQFVKTKKLRKQLSPTLLASLARDKKHTRFFLAFAEFTGLDYQTATRIWAPDKTEAVAIACKASEMPRDLFATLVVLMSKDGTKDLSFVKSLGIIYEDLPKSTADRTLRFWKMRKATQDAQAA